MSIKSGYVYKRTMDIAIGYFQNSAAAACTSRGKSYFKLFEVWLDCSTVFEDLWTLSYK